MEAPRTLLSVMAVRDIRLTVVQFSMARDVGRTASSTGEMMHWFGSLLWEWWKDYGSWLEYLCERQREEEVWRELDFLFDSPTPPSS